MSRSRPLLAVLLAALALSCRSQGSDVVGGSALASARAARANPPLDHLAPGELAPGKAVAFGFAVPRQMRVEARFPDAVHASGSVSAAALIDYIRKRIDAPHAELADNRTIFTRARILGTNSQRLFRFEIVSAGTQTELVIRDVTPPPTTQGISEAERWRRAGLTPEGKPLDVKRMQ